MYAPDSWILRGPAEGCKWHDYTDEGECPECEAAESEGDERYYEYLREGRFDD